MKDFLNLVDARYSDYDPDCSWFYVDEDNYSITSSETLKEALDKMCNDDFIGTILDSYDALGDLTSDKLLETAILDAKVSKAVGEEERSL